MIYNRLNAVLNLLCSCGGRGPDDPNACLACRLWHGVGGFAYEDEIKRLEANDGKLAEAQRERDEAVDAAEQMAKASAERFIAQSKTVNHLDLMVDEFKRIRALMVCGFGGTSEAEIIALCDRAVTRTVQNVPVIQQRDNAERELAALKGQTCETCVHRHRNIVLGGYADQCAVHELGDCGDFGWSCGRWAPVAPTPEG